MIFKPPMGGQVFQFSIFNLYLGLIGASFLVGSFGIYLFLREWGVEKRQVLISVILYLILPAGLYILQFQNGLNHINMGLLPYVLVLFKKFLSVQGDSLSRTTGRLLVRLLVRLVRLDILIALFISFLLLIDISILLPLLVGIVALFIASSERIPLEETQEKIVKTVLIFLLAFALASVWYTPRFWWVLLTNPSFGGVPLVNLIYSLFNILLNLIPLLLATVVVKWRRIRPKGHLLFAALFTATFFFLSLVRFLSDPDFVMDWVGFGLELQFGLAILCGRLISLLWDRNLAWRMGCAIGACILIVFNGFIISNLIIRPSDKDYQERIVKMLTEYVKEDSSIESSRVFLSGSPVFWINQRLALNQVRGANDPVSIHPLWAHAAFQIREGEDPSFTKAWLSALGASYVLVHTKDSSEEFMDFKNPQKFKEFQLLTHEKGDYLYHIDDVSVARLAHQDILDVPRPQGGADMAHLSSYVSALRGGLSLTFPKPNTIQVEAQLKKRELISLAITYDPGWKLVEGGGKVVADSLGNMAVVPLTTGSQRFILVYQPRGRDWVLPLVASGILFSLLLLYPGLAFFLKKRLPKLHLGVFEREDEDY